MMLLPNLLMYSPLRPTLLPTQLHVSAHGEKSVFVGETQLCPGAWEAEDRRKVVQRLEEVQNKLKLTTLHTETVACAELAVH